MKKLSLEKITGIVALSYLVLIPVAGYFMWQRIKLIDADVVLLCQENGMDLKAEVTPISAAKSSLKKLIGASKKA
jgi:hypothetical protein